jgi:DNA-binding HxlR family transcriptional regulator
MRNTTECPAEKAISFPGGKWKIRIIFLLYQNKKNNRTIFLKLNKNFEENRIR